MARDFNAEIKQFIEGLVADGMPIGAAQKIYDAVGNEADYLAYKNKPAPLISDIKPAAVSIFSRIRTSLAALFTAFPIPSIIITVALIIAIILGWAFCQGTSPQEQKAEDARVETMAAETVVQADEIPIAEAEKGLEIAKKNSAEAVKRLPAVRERTRKAEIAYTDAKQPVLDTPFSAADSERCKTYPETCKPDQPVKPVTVDQGFTDAATQAFKEVRALKTLTDAQKEQISVGETAYAAKLAELDATNKKLQAVERQNADYTVLVSAQKQQIKELAAIKCDTTSLFFGIIKKKRCR